MAKRKPQPAPQPAANDAEVRTLKVEFAAIKRDLVAFFGQPLRPSDEVLTRHAGGFRAYKVFSNVKRDGRVHAALQKRRRAVIARNWNVEPGGERPIDKQAAEFVTWALKQAKFDKLTGQMHDAIPMGFSVVELVWETRRDPAGALRTIPVRSWKRDQNRFVFTVDGEPRLLTPDQPLNGVELPARKFVITRHGEEDTDDYYGIGLCSLLFWPVLFKRQNVTFWSIFNDKYGSPTAYAKHAPGAAEQEKQDLLDLLRGLAQDSAIVVPKDWELGFLEKAAGAGGGTSYKDFVRFCGDEISEIVNGETLTTNIGDSGSRSAAEVHDGVRVEVSKSDADLICETIDETVIRWLVDMNMPGAAYPTVTRDFSVPEDLDKRSQVDERLSKLGFKRTMESVTEIYGDGFEQAEPPAPPTMPGALPAPGAKPVDPAKPEPAKEDPEDGDGEKPASFAAPGAPNSDQLADRLAIEAAGEGDKLIDKAKALADSVGSLEEFRDQLPALFAEMDVRELGTTIERAIDAAKLHGWVDSRKGER